MINRFDEDYKVQKLKDASQYLTPDSNDSIVRNRKVYSPSECIGSIIMGECKGSILDTGGYHQTCHGTMINGECTGSMF